MRSATCIVALAAFALAGCRKAGDDSTEAREPGEPWTAPIPQTVIELGAREALLLAVRTDMRQPWSALQGIVSAADGSCPAYYDGEPPEFDIAGAGTIGSGHSWSDSCEVAGTEFSGYMYWENRVADTDAARMIVADGIVGTDAGVLFEFDGNGDDEVQQDGAGWSYESGVYATVSGELASPDAPSGYRTDLELYYSGGDDEFIEVYGNLYFFDHTFGSAFDSLFMDMELQGTAGADSDDCLLEPKGVISIRDTNADWYDIVFEPKYKSTLEYQNDPYTACDGCGTLYYRGYEQPTPICPDFSGLWDGVLSAPATTEFDL